MEQSNERCPSSVAQAGHQICMQEVPGALIPGISLSGWDATLQNWPPPNQEGISDSCIHSGNVSFLLLQSQHGPLWGHLG